VESMLEKWWEQKRLSRLRGELSVTNTVEVIFL
jgi:hypothetical protein